MKPDTRWSIQWKVEREKEIDFVLPASIQKAAPNELELPMTYIALVLGLHQFAFKIETTGFPQAPPLECRLEYSDIGGTKHRMDLSIRIQVYAVIGEGLKGVVQGSRRNA